MSQGVNLIQPNTTILRVSILSNHRYENQLQSLKIIGLNLSGPPDGAGWIRT